MMTDIYDCTALWHVSDQKSELRTHPRKKAADNLVLKSLYSMVSTGTENLVANGRVPEDLHHQMRVPYMQGDFAFPCTYGYSLVAEVIDADQKSQNWIGKKVHALHPHQSIALVDLNSVSLLPNTIATVDAALVSNLETVINAVWDSQCQLGDRLVIAGFGNIGALLAMTLQKVHHGEIFLVETNQQRAALAMQLGIKVVEWDEIGECAIAFNTSASESCLQQCIDSVGFEGKVIELSWYGNQSVKLELGHDFHSQRKRIVSSQVSHIPGSKAATWDIAKRKKLAFDLIASGTFRDLPKTLVPFSHSADVFTKLRENQLQSLNLIFDYEA